jgi:cellobiose-specific phosphotransferase system component IIB
MELKKLSACQRPRFIEAYESKEEQNQIGMVSISLIVPQSKLLV